ncbi:D-glycero-beta-D-manno-heptose 1,7-bisphosphate 7-phosphatase [Roseateles depolymerans]|uniref:D,D-heptose 1,7-bisphosphate phosphatase n=1 Tax=Roseateles depolymerans TaxID=76731 RepID=A0A0U3MTM8_9BURK|nr:D-glycero-beta-D-manno-heptose 1,7-bisphosphate 7-phosphatase [Roseateles depolymerans]ALV05220.1 D,D-heptose 1,7-bisphosphate phosphatase [Roseateles depolymerans]REG14764.1 D-glycero-D-manno-heptose 1,7-bisphosphate phosphatase [Roseateles depolymerans]
MSGRSAAFLDRDGVINLDHGYVHRWEDFQFVPGAVEALRRLQAAGHALVIVTNQSGVARGLYAESDVRALGERLREHLHGEGIQLDAIEYCPHLPGAAVPAYAVHCDCRKPEPGMILRAAHRLGIDLARSVMVGDKASDMEAAQRAGVGRAFLVATDGVGEPDDLLCPMARTPRCHTSPCRSLQDAVDHWLAEAGSSHHP